jgi:hypothetical protein
VTDDPEEIRSVAPPPGTNKVELTVGGHSITVESGDPLADVTAYALLLYDRTKDAAKKIPFGFDVAGGQFERAEPYVEPGSAEGWEDGHGGRMGRQPAQDGTTRRLGVPDPAGHHRTRLGPLPVDRGRQTLPGEGY